jgi:hypothetical protein
MDIRGSVEAVLRFDRQTGHAGDTLRCRGRSEGAGRYGVESAAAEQAVAGLTGVRNIKDVIEIAYETWAEHDAVVGAAWLAPGAFDVRDGLFVTG